jgi:hypothetical protein
MTTKITESQKPAETKAKTEPAGKAEAKPTAKLEVKPTTTPQANVFKPQPQSQSESPKTPTITNITKEIDNLWQAVSNQAKLITELQEAVARKRRPPASNGKVKVRDKKTGKVYPSKNGCYQTLLREGALKDLVAKGIFGDIPEKNTFGWYALKRELPDRFEELTDKESDEQAKTPTSAVPNAK